MSDLGFLALLYIGVGLLTAVIAVPLVLRKVKPNPFYGFRTRKTLTNEAVWYEANVYAGKWLAGAGIVVASAAVAFSLMPGMDVGIYAWVMTGALVIAMSIGLITSFRYLNQIAK